MQKQITRAWNPSVNDAVNLCQGTINFELQRIALDYNLLKSDLLKTESIHWS